MPTCSNSPDLETIRIAFKKGVADRCSPISVLRNPPAIGMGKPPSRLQKHFVGPNIETHPTFAITSGDSVCQQVDLIEQEGKH